MCYGNLGILSLGILCQLRVDLTHSLSCKITALLRFRTTSQLTGSCLSSEGLNLFYSFSHGAELELSFLQTSCICSKYSSLPGMSSLLSQIQLLTQGLAHKSSLQGSFRCVPVCPSGNFLYTYLSSLCPDWKIFGDRDYKTVSGSS